MTIEDLISSNALFITPADASSLLNCDPQILRKQAHTNPSLLGFPVIVVGNRVRIPRVQFLKFLGFIGRQQQ